MLLFIFIVAETLRSTRFGNGEGPIHLDDVECVGNENSIFDCVHSEIGIHNCDHSDDVSVLCHNGRYSSMICLFIIDNPYPFFYASYTFPYIHSF